VADCSLLLSAMAGAIPDESVDRRRPHARRDLPLAAARGARPLQGVRIGSRRAVGAWTPGPGQVFTAARQQSWRASAPQPRGRRRAPNPFTPANRSAGLLHRRADYHQPWFPQPRRADYRPPRRPDADADPRRLGLSALQYLDLHRRRPAAFQAALPALPADEAARTRVAVPVTPSPIPRCARRALIRLILSPRTNPENGKLA